MTGQLDVKFTRQLAVKTGRWLHIVIINQRNDLILGINMEAIPENFFLADVTIARSSGDRRHLIFATTEQLALLCHLKGWYVDGIF